MIKQIKIFWKLSLVFVVMILIFVLTVYYLNGLIADKYTGSDLNSENTGRNLQLIFTLVFTVVFSLATAAVFVRVIIKRPVDKMMTGMDKLANKEFDFRMEENEQDEFIQLASSFNDMADMLALSLNELQKNRDYMEGVLESSADLIITVNASEKIQTVNSGAENALEYKRTELIGKPIEILFADPYDRKVAIDKLKFTDNVVNFETQFVTKSGKLRDVLLTLSRMRNPNAAIIGTIGISKDITEQKLLQNQLIQSERYAAIGQVFTGLQHTMKNMLNACKGGAYMVKLGLAKDNHKMLVEGWEIVQEGITSLTDMSMDMLKYVKEFKPTISNIDLTGALSEIYRMIKPTAQDKGVTCMLNISSQLPQVPCDEKMIYSAVMDIVSNAVDACVWKEYSGNEIPEVSMGAYPDYDNSELVIEIKDNGCGMSEEVKENIFTPFFSTKSKAGTGLGLSITSRMIGVHNGRIQVDSVPEQGTVFKIILPLERTTSKKETIDGKESISS